MAYLIKKISGAVIETVEIPGPALRIGRGTANELHLDDLLVSLDHARIEQGEGAWLLTDLGSAQGTFVNEQRIQTARLSDGDRILIGPYHLAFRSAAGSETAILEMEETGEAPSAPVSDYLGSYSLSTRWLNKTVLSIAGILAVLVGLGGSLVSGHRMIVMPGPLSAGHALFARDCAWCHTAWRSATSTACLGCHTIGGHHEAKNEIAASSPRCTACHVEHKGRTSLASAPERECVWCHKASVAASIHGFTLDHTEFAVILGGEDGNRLKMNHKMHLDQDLTGLDERGPLTCTRCHTPDADGAHMTPVHFDPACTQCHTLDFDSKMPEMAVPHRKQPKDLDGMLRAIYADAFRAEQVKAGGAPLKKKVFIEERTEKAEDGLFGKTRRKNTQGKCLQCHYFDLTNMSGEDDRLPPLAQVSTPARWLPKAMFSHHAHSVLTCVSCHETAPESEAATDVLLPGITTCRQCHVGPGGAPADCSDCHLFHDRTAPRDLNGSYTIRALTTGRTVPVAPATPDAPASRPE